MDAPEKEPHGRLSPGEAFSILGNETRLSILQALWEGPRTPISFSDLRERIAHDDPGNFNYHLDELVGHFVAKTSDGYELREAGAQVIRAVLAGAINRDPRFGPVECERQCPYCGGTVELRYEEQLTVRCTECPGTVGGGYPRGTYVQMPFPPAGLQNRSPEEIVEAAHTLYDAKITPMMDGVCPECAGRTSVSIDVCEDHAEEGVCERCESRHPIWAEYRCEHCEYARRCIVWFEVLNDPTVIAFLSERGLSESVPFSKMTWRNAPYVGDITAAIHEEDPLRIRITIPVDDAELRVTVDESVDVVELEEYAGDE